MKRGKSRRRRRRRRKFLLPLLDFLCFTFLNITSSQLSGTLIPRTRRKGLLESRVIRVKNMMFITKSLDASCSLDTFTFIFFLFFFPLACFPPVFFCCSVWSVCQQPFSPVTTLRLPCLKTTIPLESDVCFSHGKEQVFFSSFFLLILANSLSIYRGEQGSGYFSFFLNSCSPSCHTLRWHCPVHFAFRSVSRQLLLVGDCA